MTRSFGSAISICGLTILSLRSRLLRTMSEHARYTRRSFQWCLMRPSHLLRYGFSMLNFLLDKRTLKRPERYLVRQSAGAQDRKSLRLMLNLKRNSLNSKDVVKSMRGKLKFFLKIAQLGLNTLNLRLN